MATSLAAVIKGKHGMSAGNLIGSDIFNILGVLGIAGDLQSHVNTGRGIQLPHYAFRHGVSCYVLFLRTGWRLSRIEGIILVTIGLVRWIF